LPHIIELGFLIADKDLMTPVGDVNTKNPGNIRPLAAPAKKAMAGWIEHEPVINPCAKGKAAQT